jgi:HAD superfamily hydrolase (TIGR01509 family)
MKKKKIALLDLGGVVFQSIGNSNQIINWKVITKLNYKYGYELNTGKEVFPDFLSDYNAITNQTLTGHQFLESVFNTLKLNDELIKYLRENYDIVIVSDNYKENIKYISKRFNFENWTIMQLYSFDYQMIKSNPLFFAEILNALSEYSKEEMIFIDDSQNNIKSAALHGIRGVLFKNNAQVQKDLRTHRYFQKSGTDSMKNVQLKTNPEVELVFNNYPDPVRKKILNLRRLILETANEIEDITSLEETLKWGEPSYLVKHGSTIRIDWKKKSPEQFAMYFKCTSKLVPTFKMLYNDLFKFEGNRAIVFQMHEVIPEIELKKCIKAGLTYHKVKNFPQLGLS